MTRAVLLELANICGAAALVALVWLGCAVAFGA